jgi:hypothetical protein
MEKTLKGKRFVTVELRNSFAGGTQQHHVSAVPEMLHTMGKKTGQMYCLQWRVF